VIRETRSFRASTGRSPRRALFAVLVTVMIGSVLAAPASASPDTIRRGFGNIVGGPMDMILSPITGILTLAQNLQDIDDSPGVRLTYALPGWVWLTGLNLGAGGIRAITGCLEMLPGVILFPFKTDIDPLFDPVDDAGALIELENPLVDIENPWVYWNPLVAPFAIQPKWGIDYTKAQF